MLARTPANAPAAPAHPRLSPAPVTVARAMPSSLAAAGTQASAALSQAAGSAASAAASAITGGGGSSGGGDAAYDELLRRLRDEQEQLGQLIQHPF
jgi:hypothetical protein